MNNIRIPVLSYKIPKREREKYCDSRLDIQKYVNHYYNHIEEIIIIMLSTYIINLLEFGNKTEKQLRRKLCYMLGKAEIVDSIVPLER